jgi:predicted  nucleic acid-binding Zn-ribbon protein
MRVFQFGPGTDLEKVAAHIRVTLSNLAHFETGLARENLRRKEVYLDSHLEQGRLAEESITAFDSEIATAAAEVQRTSGLVAAAEAELQKAQKSKDSLAQRDAVNRACQVRADAFDHAESLKRRRLAAQSELESINGQRSSIDASLTALRTELARIEAFYSVLERKA